MTREIKFRVWNGSRMFYDDLTVIGPDIGFNALIKKIAKLYRLMQYTGLKDKNGKEIYEGDVVEHERYDKPYSKSRKKWKVRGVVEWYSGFNHSEETVAQNPVLKENPSMFNQNPMFRLRVSKGQKDGGYNWSEFHDCEIIGNIYENPELLVNE